MSDAGEQCYSVANLMTLILIYKTYVSTDLNVH